MIKVLKNADIYAPEHLGLRDILIVGSEIEAVEPRIDLEPGVYGEVVDLHGAAVVPGYIDGHVHITGGGGEQGPCSRVPECRLSELVSAGVTTVVGLLGTDSITRSLENLLAAARALEGGGISAYMLTGAYRCPSLTLTGSVMRDLVLIDKVIGVKIAVSDHRSSAISVEEMARLFTESRVGGMVGGKAGLTVVHMGSGKAGLQPLLEAAERSDTPLSAILPTHCGRNKDLLNEAVAYAGRGGNIDITAEAPDRAASTGGAARQIAEAVRSGCPIAAITLSSDGYGSQPVFNERMECVAITYTRCTILHDEVRRMVENEGLSLTDALRPITSNVADRLGLSGRKGVIAPGADADLVVWDDRKNIAAVFAKGRPAFQNGEALLKGRFE